MKKEKLFEKFPPVTTGEWMQKITTDLKGADFDRKLVWKTNEGFSVEPFYRNEDTADLPFTDTLPGHFPYLRGTKTASNNWLIRQDIEAGDYSRANARALDILMKGVDSLGFVLARPDTINSANINSLLDGIYIPGVEINFLSNGRAQELVNLIRELAAVRKLPLSDIRGAVEADPIGRLLANGTLCIPLDEGFSYLAELTRSAEDLPYMKTIHLNAGYLQNSGADIVQELVYALSAGNEYLVQLTERGLEAKTAAAKIRFSFSAGPEYFLEIAKLRAARLLWSVILNGFIQSENDIPPMVIHSKTCRWNKTVFDPYVNMLRTQTEAMSAILGGADSVTVEPYDSVFRTPDEFSERIARNQQLLLREEAYFEKVIDPAAGSYYIDNLTAMISDNAWKGFLRINEEGGLLESLKKGSFQKEIFASAMKRRKNTSGRKLILVGTNQYPDSSGRASDYAVSEMISAPCASSGDMVIEPVHEFRAAEELENIRLAVERSEKAPVVFLLPTGDPVMRKARSQFSLNFFGCAGYRVIDNNSFGTVTEGVSAAVASDADIVVVCSSDDEYLLYAPEVIRLLHGRALVVIAGYPSCSEELKAAGIEHFIHIRSDMAETLGNFNRLLGVSS